MSTTSHPEPTNEQLWAQPPLAAQVPPPAAQLAPVTHPALAVPVAAPSIPSRAAEKASLALAIVSLGVGVPLTAIATNQAGVVGLVISWIGIVGVNFVYARGRRP